MVAYSHTAADATLQAHQPLPAKDHSHPPYSQVPESVVRLAAHKRPGSGSPCSDTMVAASPVGPDSCLRTTYALGHRARQEAVVVAEEAAGLPQQR